MTVIFFVFNEERKPSCIYIYIDYIYAKRDVLCRLGSLDHLNLQLALIGIQIKKITYWVFTSLHALKMLKNK